MEKQRGMKNRMGLYRTGIFLLVYILVFFPGLQTSKASETSSEVGQTGFETSTGCFSGDITNVCNCVLLTLENMAFSSAQQATPFRRKRTVRPAQAFGIGGNLLGPTLGFASVYMQYSYGQMLQAEAGIDLSTVYGGLNIYPPLPLSVEGLSPYMGLMIGYSDPARQNLARGIYAYMPVGFRYVTPDDWYICVEFAATTSSNIKTSPLFLGIKLGYLFKW
jgi:hypothetical protein